MRVTVGHFEILARDPDRLARFFREALGWYAESVAWDGPAYKKLRPAPGATPPALPIGGGILADAADQAPLLVFHLEEGTLEEALARIEVAGGAIETPPEAIGGMGRFARFRDPDGRAFGLWEGASRTNWAKVAAMTDAEIDTSDIPPLGEEFFERARLRRPSPQLPRRKTS